MAATYGRTTWRRRHDHAPSVTNPIRFLRLTTLPETRRAIFGAVRSGRARDLVRTAHDNPRALLRELKDPVYAAGLLRTAARHPATRELGGASLMFVPGRYVTVGLAAMWAGRRFLERSVAPRRGR